MRDARSIVVAVSGVVGIVVIVLIALSQLPDSLPSGRIDTGRSDAIVAIAAAAMTAIGTVVGAYFESGQRARQGRTPSNRGNVRRSAPAT